MKTNNPLLWWVFSCGEPIYAVRSRAEARKLALAWHYGVRVAISLARHRRRVDAIAALDAGEVEIVYGGEPPKGTADGKGGWVGLPGWVRP